MRFDDKFLNWLNWFINSKIMTLLQFNPGEPVRRTGFRTPFFTKFKIFLKRHQNLHRKLLIDEI